MKKNISGIYAITNKLNNKKYIGSSKSVYYRWKQNHLPQLINGNHYNRHLQSSWNKYGEDSFEFSVLEECDELLLLEKEGYWIEHHRSWEREYGYNLTRIIDDKQVFSKESINKRTESRTTEDYWRTGVNAQIIELFNQGLSKNKIAIELEITRSAVYSCLEYNGLHKNTGRGSEIKLTYEVKQQIEELRKQKKTVKEIIEITGVSKTQLNRTKTIDDGMYCSKEVKRTSYRTVTPEVIEKVKSLRSEGYRWEEIEKKVGVSRFALHENGITTMLKDTPARKRTITIITEAIENKIHQMLAEGCAIKYISEELGIGQSTVRLRKKANEKLLVRQK